MSGTRARVAVVGASAGLGRALAEGLAARGHALVLAARAAADLTALRRDLTLVHGAEVQCLPVDLAAPDFDAARFAGQMVADAPLDAVYLPIGASSNRDDGCLDGASARRLLAANLGGVAELMAALWPHLCSRPRATVAGFGSIAALRGRSNNVVYAAAKRGLESLFESYRHKASGTAVAVQFYRVGFLDTAQSWGKRTPLAKAAPQRAAASVLRDLHRQTGVRFLPRRFALLAPVVRWMPWPIFRRLRF